MTLHLRVVSYRGAAPERALEHRFDRAGGSIGRTSDNDLALPDPEKIVSRRHARIAFVDGCYQIQDVGGNATILNGQPLGGSRLAPLADGDELTIGEFVLQARLASDDAAVDAWAGWTAAGAPAQPALPDPLAEAAGGPPRAAADLPFEPLPDPLSGAPPAVGAAAAAGLRGSARDDVPPQSLPFVPVAMPVAPPGVAPAPAAPLQPPAAATPIAPLIPDDYDPLLSRIVLPPRPAAAPSPPAAAPAPHAAPRAAEPPRAPAPAAVAPASPAAAAAAPRPAPRSAPAVPASAAADPTLAALLRGLGLADLQVPGLSGPELADLCGQMLRVAVGGIMQTLAARATTKNEIRIDMTLVAVRDNNPLKFLPDVNSALTQMVSGRSPGYLPAVKAIGAAIDDIRTHEIAMMAGMRAALSAVLERLDPKSIERGLGDGGAIDRMIALKRKASLWDRLVEVHGEIAREAGDDFQKLFRERFTAAYEEQIERIRPR